MSTIVPDDAPKPRLCHMKKWPDFNGYGFNLHAERGKAGQFIGKVDLESPADVGGMKEGDRIVEVNGTNIGNENHQQVVQRIKAVPNETKLLVVDNDSDKYYKDRKIVVRGDMPNVRVFVCPDTKPTAQPNGTASQLTTVEVNHTPTQEPHVTTQVNHEEEAAPPPPLPTSVPPPEVNGEPEAAVMVTTVLVSESTVVETQQESQPERQPSPEPAPEPVLLAAPIPVVYAEPEPVVQAEPEPVRQATPEPVVQAAPEPVVQYEPEPVMQAAPEPEPEPVMLAVAPVVQTTVTEVRTEVKEEVRSEPEPVLESTPPPVAEPPRVETPPPAEPEPEPEAAPSRPLVRGKDDEPFRMSAKEFRERMVSKKRDVKNNNLSMAEKFQLFQKM